MTFIWPVMLFSLVLIPVFIVIYIDLQRERRKKLAATRGSLSFMQANARKPGARSYVVPALFLAGLSLMLVALARPQAMITLPRIEGTIILAFDVSGSMAADDLTPTRMEAAKEAAREFIDKQPDTVQIGIVAFSDNGFSVQKPTNDKDSLLATINRLTPQRGTSLANGILASLNTINIANGKKSQGTSLNGSQPQPGVTPSPSPTPLPKGTYINSVIVMLTDGENNESPDPMEAAQTAIDRGVRVYTVGIGSPTGTNVHINGYTLHTQLDEDMLQQISQLTGGTYYNAQSTEQLVSIYNNLNPQLIVKPEQTEITSVFAGASILVLLIGGVFSMMWFNRLP
jgi:Ca-activated chloride channel homolog